MSAVTGTSGGASSDVPGEVSRTDVPDATAAASPRRRRSRFHLLRVAHREQLTDDAVALTFAVPAELRDTFAFAAGQHVTLRREVEGHDLRRTYSVCASATAGDLRVAVKRQPGGAFSTYATDVLAVGDELAVMPPSGRFTPRLDPARARHYAAVAAGSGVTPILSIVATALEVEPASRVTLLLANRTARSVMFAEELQDLRDRFLGRLDLHHVLSGEARESELLSGRLDADRFGRILDVLLPPATVDEWFLCGPEAMTDVTRTVLAARGVDPATVHRELFAAGESGRPPPTTPVAGTGTAAVRDATAGAGATAGTGAATGTGNATGTRATAGGEAATAPGARAEPATPAAPATVAGTARLDGRTSRLDIARGETVLDALLRVRPDAPYACRGGVCGTCRARVVEGRVEMRTNYALESDETAAGYVLTCQAEPRTGTLAVDYDA